MNPSPSSNEFTLAQRIVAGVGLSIGVLLAFAHNPISGYTTSSQTSFMSERALDPCSEQDKKGYRADLTAIYYRTEAGAEQRRFLEQFGTIEEEINRKVARCHLLRPGLQTDSATTSEFQTVVTPLPLSQWHSNTPMIAWAGAVVNVTYAVLAVGVVCAIFIFLVLPKQSVRVTD